MEHQFIEDTSPVGSIRLGPTIERAYGPKKLQAIFEQDLNVVLTQGILIPPTSSGFTLSLPHGTGEERHSSLQSCRPSALRRRHEGPALKMVGGLLLLQPATFTGGRKAPHPCLPHHLLVVDDPNAHDSVLLSLFPVYKMDTPPPLAVLLEDVPLIQFLNTDEATYTTGGE
ncbi:hypothetical protein E2C01_101140 [Portunus trituberculatus]|uniref:Uncharacterized protein n=1 Tax=Portunus trituberculatus TaxID=210409 RepID=A0A5B7KE01_PORTR|nr:hypothetical protein [Portunus trituberculatus]